MKRRRLGLTLGELLESAAKFPNTLIAEAVARDDARDYKPLELGAFGAIDPDDVTFWIRAHRGTHLTAEAIATIEDSQIRRVRLTAGGTCIVCGAKGVALRDPGCKT